MRRAAGDCHISLGRAEPLSRRPSSEVVVSSLCFQTVTTLAWPTGDEPATAPTPAWPLDAVLAGIAGAGLRYVGLDLLSIDAAHAPPADLLAQLDDRGLTCSDVGVLI